MSVVLDYFLYIIIHMTFLCIKFWVDIKKPWKLLIYWKIGTLQLGAHSKIMGVEYLDHNSIALCVAIMLNLIK